MSGRRALGSGSRASCLCLRASTILLAKASRKWKIRGPTASVWPRPHRSCLFKTSLLFAWLRCDCAAGFGPRADSSFFLAPTAVAPVICRLCVAAANQSQSSAAAVKLFCMAAPDKTRQADEQLSRRTDRQTDERTEREAQNEIFYFGPRFADADCGDPEVLISGSPKRGEADS